MTRDEVVLALSESAIYGNLGLFVGAGFSIAALHDQEKVEAPSWVGLVTKIADELDVSIGDEDFVGRSCPELASLVALRRSDATGEIIDDVRQNMKGMVADSTAFLPTGDVRDRVGPALEKLKLSWILTTNYDQVLESLLASQVLSLGPNRAIVSPRHLVPLYHLHGVRTHPSELILFQEDYTRLLRPMDYRQTKLALLLRESTVLVIGYGLGDVNVLTAIDWAENVYSHLNEGYPRVIVQLLYSENPASQPYSIENGIIVIETDDVLAFLDELSAAVDEQFDQYNAHLERYKEIARRLVGASDAVVEKFISNREFRREIVDSVGELPEVMIIAFVDFLSKAVRRTWARSSAYGDFEGYRQNMSIQLDILTGIPENTMPPLLLEVCIRHFNHVAGFIDRANERMPGTAFDATALWFRRRNEVPLGSLKEAILFCESHACAAAADLFRDALDERD